MYLYLTGVMSRMLGGFLAFPSIPSSPPPTSSMLLKYRGQMAGAGVGVIVPQLAAFRHYYAAAL